jgi:hypothetical protein
MIFFSSLIQDNLLDFDVFNELRTRNKSKIALLINPILCFYHYYTK